MVRRPCFALRRRQGAADRRVVTQPLLTTPRRTLPARFYPEHYAPFVSDVHGIADFEPQFDMGTPFLPFEQLMAVLPPASRSHVPPAYAVRCLLGSLGWAVLVGMREP